MLLVFVKAVTSSWAKTRTLNTIWQVRVRHFQDRQAISHRVWVKTATAPLFLQMACETCTQDTVQWHTEMSELSKLWSGWCDSLFAKPYTEKASLLICTTSTAHCRTCVSLRQGNIDQDILHLSPGHQMLMLQHQSWADVTSQKSTEHKAPQG